MLCVGSHDRISTVQDAYLLKQRLNNAHTTIMEIEAGHNSFMWGRDMTYLGNIISYIQSY